MILERRLGGVDEDISLHAAVVETDRHAVTHYDDSWIVRNLIDGPCTGQQPPKALELSRCPLITLDSFGSAFGIVQRPPQLLDGRLEVPDTRGEKMPAVLGETGTIQTWHAAHRSRLRGAVLGTRRTPHAPTPTHNEPQ